MRGVRVCFVAGVRREQDIFYIEGRGAVPVTPALWALFADGQGAAFASLAAPEPVPVPAEQRGRVLAYLARSGPLVVLSPRSFWPLAVHWWRDLYGSKGLYGPPVKPLR